MNTRAREYTVIYEQAGNNCSAYVPDLPGCVAAADTQQEIEQMITEAIELYIETLQMDGLPIPDPKTRAGQVAVAA